MSTTRRATARNVSWLVNSDFWLYEEEREEEHESFIREYDAPGQDLRDQRRTDYDHDAAEWATRQRILDEV